MKNYRLNDGNLLESLDVLKGFKVEDLSKKAQSIGLDKINSLVNEKTSGGSNNGNTGITNTGNTNSSITVKDNKKMIVPIAVGGGTMVASRFFFKTGWIASTVIGIGAGVGTHLIMNKENNNINN